MVTAMEMRHSRWDLFDRSERCSFDLCPTNFTTTIAGWQTVTQEPYAKMDGDKDIRQIAGSSQKQIVDDQNIAAMDER